MVHLWGEARLANETRQVAVSQGNLNNGHVYWKGIRDWIPEECFGAPSPAEGLGRCVRLDLEGITEPIFTDIGRNPDGSKRGHFRERSAIRKFFKLHSLRAGSVLLFERISDLHFRVLAIPNSPGQAIVKQELPAERKQVPSRKVDGVANSEAVIPPPVDGIGPLLKQIEANRGLPERNMEDAVKRLLMLLGHSECSIKFQVGRIDVLVESANSDPWAVIEVKQSLASKSARDDAHRKGFDYAGKTGARYVIITDADQYLVYDRDMDWRKYEDCRVGSFRLTAFVSSDEPTLALLRAGQ